jgi:hypothetical protein
MVADYRGSWRSPPWPAGGLRRSMRAPEHAGSRHPEVRDKCRGEIDGEAGVGPLLEPRRYRRKQQHHAEETEGQAIASGRPEPMRK